MFGIPNFGSKRFDSLHKFSRLKTQPCRMRCPGHALEIRVKACECSSIKHGVFELFEYKRLGAKKSKDVATLLSGLAFEWLEAKSHVFSPLLRLIKLKDVA